MTINTDPTAAIDDVVWGELRAALDGDLALPGEPGYELAQPWNVAVPLTPLAVVAAASAQDIAATVRWAGQHRVRVMVQRTGHSAMPLAGEAVLVHTGRLDSVQVDAAEGTATVGAGAVWSQVVDAAAEHGLLPVCGSAPHVGVMGYLTGGGIGPMVRSLGISSDRVRSFQVVTGDGELRDASPEENPDLFWGLRGGRHTVGIVASAVVELVRCERFFGGNAFFAEQDMPAVVHAWQRFAAALPEDGTTSVCVLQLPPMPGVPEPLAGRMTVSVRLAWLGDEERGRALADEILAVAPSVLGGYGPMSPRDIGMIHMDPTEPLPFKEFGLLLDDLPAEAVEAFLRTAGPGSGSPLLLAELRQLGGAAHREPAHPDAFCGREARFHLMTGGVPLPDPAPVRAAAGAIEDALAPWSSGAMMPNFVARADGDALRAFYDPATLDRLIDIAGRHDPAGVLRVGQSACFAGPA